jgi:two-component system LytT family response regulator
MARKLKLVVLDDDPYIISVIRDLCKDSQIVEISKTFNYPLDFIKQVPLLDFDLAVLDVQMPEMEGIIVAQMLKKKPFIFVTGADDRLRDVLSLSPIDVVTKPILKDRLDKAFEKAYELLSDKREYAMFNVAESNRKMKLRLPDIMLAVTDEVDPRHKIVYLKSGEKYTIMDYSLEKLIDACPTLIQVNKREAVSMEVVNEVEYDMIMLRGIQGNEVPKYVTLGRAFSKPFKERMFFK